MRMYEISGLPMRIASVGVFIGIIGAITAAIIVRWVINAVTTVIMIMVVVVAVEALTISRHYATRKEPSTRQMARVIWAHHGERCIPACNSCNNKMNIIN